MNYFKDYIKRICRRIGVFTLSFALVFPSASLHTYAATAEEEAALRQQIPIESNAIENWPDGPVISAESAVLMEVNTGTVLYEKNAHEKLYPASITKILTCLIAAENIQDLNAMVPISYEAVHTVPIDGTNVGLDAGESITALDCLYAILLKSANEAANAIGEYVAGSIEGFTQMMNEKAAELGCTDSHFATTNGLHDENHYTSAYDMALIGQAFFQNDLLCQISGSTHYQIPTTNTQPDIIDMYPTNKLLPGKAYAYEYLVGSKTGYTSYAQQTLVSCAEKDGMKLVCVVMKESSPTQFEDTISLFEYGFNNFHMLNVSENETRYTIHANDFFQTTMDVFGSSKQFISLDTQDTIIVPNTLSFSDLSNNLTYEENTGNCFAKINYSYHDIPLGSCDVLIDEAPASDIIFDTIPKTTDLTDSKSNVESSFSETHVVFINIVPIIAILIAIILIVILILFLRTYFKSYHFSRTVREKLSSAKRNQRQIHVRRRNVRRSKKRELKKAQATVKQTSSLSFQTPRRSRTGSVRLDDFNQKKNLSKDSLNRLRSPKNRRKKQKHYEVRIHFRPDDLSDD